jgi:hypothetical protein
MHLLNDAAGGDATVTAVNYVPRFLSDEGEALVVEPDEAYALIETIGAGDEVAVEFKVLMPAGGDDGATATPDPRISELSIEINYGVGDAGGQEIVTFPVTFGAQ